ncbi:MAG TPA: redox-sensing transcriptional repressor Rex [Abditibacteriaceae bacterium]|jgi:redox-sensing transcriptional repressor
MTSEKTKKNWHDGPGALKIPQPTIERLSAYLQCVRGMNSDGIATASSTEIAQRTGINAAQFRKDLSYFGEFGTPGLGYDVNELEAHLSRIMGLDAARDVLLVGAGNLGAALSSYMGFSERGFRVVAAFDTDPAKVGQTLAGRTIHHLDELTRINSEVNALVGVVTVPRAAAQEAVDKLVAAGVLAILNFAPTAILVRPGIAVRNVDLTSEMEVLSYYLRAK